MSAICQEALEAYIEAKEKEKWDKGIALATNNDQYLAFVKLTRIIKVIHERFCLLSILTSAH